MPGTRPTDYDVLRNTSGFHDDLWMTPLRMIRTVTMPTDSFWDDVVDLLVKRAELRQPVPAMEDVHNLVAGHPSLAQAMALFAAAPQDQDIQRALRGVLESVGNQDPIFAARISASIGREYSSGTRHPAAPAFVRGRSRTVLLTVACVVVAAAALVVTLIVATSDESPYSSLGPLDRNQSSSVVDYAIAAINAHDWSTYDTINCEGSMQLPAVSRLPAELHNTLQLTETISKKVGDDMANYRVDAAFGPGDYPGGHVERQTSDAYLHVRRPGNGWCILDLDINRVNLPQ